MRLQQLMEGQTNQIERLRPSAPVALYHPTDVRGAVKLIKDRGTEAHELIVTPSLKSAAPLGDVVIYFYGRGKDLQPPPRLARSHPDARMAERQYPESFRPLVSFSLLSQRPMASYTGFLSPGNVERIYVMQNGKPEAMSIAQFGDHVMQLMTDAKRQGTEWG